MEAIGFNFLSVAERLCYRARMPLLLAAALFSSLGAFPSAPTTTTFRVRDFGGRAFPDAVVASMDGRLSVRAFGRRFVFTGTAWRSDRPPADEESGAVAFLALFEPEAHVVRADAAGRPLVLVDVPAGAKRARIEYRYDGAGLAAVNLVFSDGSGFQLRRTSAEPAQILPSEFEPPRRVAPPPPDASAAAAVGGADSAAVERLFAVSISEREQLEFERQGAVGRFRPRPPR